MYNNFPFSETSLFYISEPQQFHHSQKNGENNNNATI